MTLIYYKWKNELAVYDPNKKAYKFLGFLDTSLQARRRDVPRLDKDRKRGIWCPTGIAGDHLMHSDGAAIISEEEAFKILL